MCFKCVNLLIVLLNILNYVKSQDLEGAWCTSSTTGIDGQCKLITSCPSVLAAIRNVSPQICGHVKLKPIVCCPTETDFSRPTSSSSNVNKPSTQKSTSPNPKPTPPSPQTTPPRLKATSRRPEISRYSSRPVFRVGDKSKQKCREYEKYVYAKSFGLRSSEPGDDECALGGVATIIGGTAATPREFPHSALLGFETDHNKIKWLCGGSLISDNFVLTAAHCLMNRNYGTVKYVRLGDLVISSNVDDAEPQHFNIKNIFKPSKRDLPKDDIALLQLNGKAELNTYVRPACLNVNPNLSEKFAIASGWGNTDAKGTTTDELMKVTLDMFTHEECQNIWSSIGRNIEERTQLCAGSRNDSRDTCQGDSGGPLQIISKPVYCSYEIIGITSFGKGCGEVNVPAIYTRVSNYIKWIEDIVWP